MQTWAKRGVQAALVTGGMLAVGSGVASAEQACPERPNSPLGESANALDQLGTGGRCLSGDLYPENAPLVESRAAHQVTALAGTIDPVRDLLPAVENDMTRELPALRDWHTGAPVAPLHLAGWIADPADARPLELAGLPPFDGGRPVTPAEGFHRSLSWAGPIGEVIRGGAAALDEGAFRPGAVLDVPADLLTPHDDLVYFDGFGQADGIVELWEGVLAAPQGGLVTPDRVDLTSAELPGLRNQLHTVPGEVLAGALSAVAAQPTPRNDFVPLEVPGELQAKAAEIPDLTGLSLVELSRAPGTTQRSESPGVQAPLPVLGELNALGGGQTSAPTVSRITSALDAPAPRTVNFTAAPLESAVAVEVVDELRAATPEHKLLTESPLRPAPAPRSGGMSLPVLDGGVPDITAVQDQTLPLPGLTQQATPRGFENADTIVFSRI
ncbi:hypothetical protein SAMN05421805_103368 [Saccharopolyspora antimicrobica]|uniref:Secreted protein n=1 Tax=Saccharopolyspora antimicrobica TaxID=455193 RepID=A0A1I4XC89_9PSEU|nr:hypothetical protein [Saccharopolyspora antimicrobica]RKT84437.1 hypothetical protein ATL45_2752 [Saccharopolyspora antimicrobica]SFN23395.1 hypothetical protein SAMN05421805_103368 [Saccharopolyspora antimicrobica]